MVLAAACTTSEQTEPAPGASIASGPSVKAVEKPICTTDKDCGKDKFCGKTKSGKKDCLPIAKEGDACTGRSDQLPEKRCPEGLTCMAPDPTKDDGPGKCVAVIGLKTIRPDREQYDGRLLGFSDARVYASDGKCSKMGCHPGRRCCNGCNGYMRLKDGSGGNIRLRDAEGKTYRCRGTECDWRNHCTVTHDRRYRVIARVVNRPLDVYLHVESIILLPGQEDAAPEGKGQAGKRSSPGTHERTRKSAAPKR